MSSAGVVTGGWIPWSNDKHQQEQEHRARWWTTTEAGTQAKPFLAQP